MEPGRVSVTTKWHFLCLPEVSALERSEGSYRWIHIPINDTAIAKVLVI